MIFMHYSGLCKFIQVKGHKTNTSIALSVTFFSFPKLRNCNHGVDELLLSQSDHNGIIVGPIRSQIDYLWTNQIIGESFKVESDEIYANFRTMQIYTNNKTSTPIDQFTYYFLQLKNSLLLYNRLLKLHLYYHSTNYLFQQHNISDQTENQKTLFLHHFNIKLTITTQLHTFHKNNMTSQTMRIHALASELTFLPC